MVDPPVDTVAPALAEDVIVNVVVLGTVLIINFLSSKLDALKLVPLGKVTLSNNIISPTSAPCAEPVVIVITALAFAVAIVALVCCLVLSKGDMSYT